MYYSLNQSQGLFSVSMTGNGHKNMRIRANIHTRIHARTHTHTHVYVIGTMS